MMTPDVTHVQTLASYELLVSFADGGKRRFSMLPYLHYPAYQGLTQPGKFGLAHVSNGTVAWSDEIDMSPDTLYLAGEEVSNEFTEQAP
ncbi:DUF2442 domain-containing protein [Gallionella capsiferriformans]|jgi:hypothetical protein|uniref:DUF2442 domain-containing protein n=1 Tax=Gallionella capsiferriformans (strain ES-2) TaxID=395494 RepID=D9SFJ9_GALCS|nr:DUF2442 domain-containing protein [Gallionella capsiferriformans]ADL55296.1 Protein of unknown function DUF2442 [Gallionella capsiferriformans ES-2]